MAEKARKREDIHTRNGPLKPKLAAVPKPNVQLDSPRATPKPRIIPEPACFVCRRDDVSAMCSVCPRAYHPLCLGSSLFFCHPLLFIVF